MPGDRLRTSIVDPNDCTLFLVINADGSINTTPGGAVPIALATDAAFSVVAASQTILAANAARVGFEFFNYGSTNIHMHFAAAAAVVTDAPIPPNTGYNQPLPSGLIYLGEIRMISDGVPTTVPNVSVLEWT